jgi:hypothetical protein
MVENCIYKMEAEGESLDQAILGAKVSDELIGTSCWECPVSGCNFSATSIAFNRRIPGTQLDVESGFYVRTKTNGQCKVDSKGVESLEQNSI